MDNIKNYATYKTEIIRDESFVGSMANIGNNESFVALE